MAVQRQGEVRLPPEGKGSARRQINSDPSQRLHGTPQWVTSAICEQGQGLTMLFLYPQHFSHSASRAKVAVK